MAKEKDKKKLDDTCSVDAGSTDDMRAARLYAIKSDILNHLGQQALSIHGIASRHGMSPTYVRRLFTAEGTSFAAFVLQQRLAVARLMLGDARFAHRAISAIAFEVGFGDVSHFQRAFRRRYGVKPSDMRDAARLGRGRLN